MAPARPERARRQGQRQAGEQEQARPGRVERQIAQGEPAGGEPGQGQERQAAVVDEQAGEPAQRERDPAHRRHPAPIRPRRDAATAPRHKATVARAASRKPATSANADQSAPGQVTPRPSPAQKVPKPHSSTPTANFSAFSGTRASGRCSARPSSTTSRRAAKAPRLAGSSRPWPAAPTATTMNTTSMPSSVTILNAVATPIPSQPPAARRPAAAAQRLGLAGEGGRLVVGGDDAGGAQDGLPQPAQAKEEDQRPDRELDRAERDAGEGRPERQDEGRQHGQGQAGAGQRRAPAAHRADREDDGER